MVKNNNKKGFTIIEVVLVLAIAGLIFLMVFIALPALQRSQRNTQRENDISRFMTEMNNYRTNNGNQTPFLAFDTDNDPNLENNATHREVANYIQRYIRGGTNDNSKFSDPNGNPYSFTMLHATALTAGAGGNAEVFSAGTDTDTDTAGTTRPTAVNNIIYVVKFARCADTEGTVVPTNGEGDTAFFYTMEGGSLYCISN